tara:strand:- start:383 stop:634 length:252 start_codon:yes stop_codon:yes gene_type:complete
MPIYVYACNACLGEWKESHGMTEDVEKCNWCESHNIYRKPSSFTNLSKPKTAKKKKVGDLTNEFIENSKQDLSKQKKELDKNR